MALNEAEFGAVCAAVERRLGVALSDGTIGGGMVGQYAAWREAIRQGGVTRVGKISARPAVVSLGVNLLSGTTSADKDYRIPADETLVVTDVRGRLGFNAWESEPVAVGNINPFADDRFWIKASNCQVALKSNDTGIKIFAEQDLVLADILREPLQFPLPGIVFKPAETIRMTATLQSTNTNAVGASSSYGIVLGGWFLSILGG